MKTLDFNEMEKIEGAIKCDEIDDVIWWLDAHGYIEQANIVMFDWMAGRIQCN